MIKLLLWIAGIATVGVPGWSMTLIAPTSDQIVREKVKITIPMSAVPSGFFEKLEGDRPFISVSVGEPGNERFVEAVAAGEVYKKKDFISFFWNSKAPYRDQSDLKTDKFFKDGKYSLKVEIHEQTQNRARTLDSASVNVVLKNKVARTNPAPGVSMTNRLAFGQINTYGVHTSVQVFDPVGLPILGGLGITSDFKVVQSVEDVRSAGELLLRCRVEDDANVTLFGQRTMVLADQPIKPQLYRLVNKHGKVIKANMFKKQAKFTITDVLPVLPGKAVKEGDSWPDALTLKIEGLTNPIKLTGTCQLDSFEWERGQECAKLVSTLTGNSRISLNNGKIRSAGSGIKVRMVTYFAYKTGKLIKREIGLDFPAVIEPGAGEFSQLTNQPAMTGADTYAEEEEDTTSGARKPAKSRTGTSSYPSGTSSMAESGMKKGSVQMNVVVQLEK
ncbi:MAG: hypothetical protein M1133_09940 [Armatimonadetes bacterium]|nr:hypothetical protein [Armatimonadota bacterium]